MVNKMSREIILHAGLHKTGTTSIQQTLYDDFNNRILEKLDILYPKNWPANHSYPVYSAFCDKPEEYRGNILFSSGLSKEKIDEMNKTNLKNLEEEVQRRRCSKIVISGEDISFLKKENLNIKLPQQILHIRTFV